MFHAPQILSLNFFRKIFLYPLKLLCTECHCTLDECGYWKWYFGNYNESMILCPQNLSHSYMFFQIVCCKIFQLFYFFQIYKVDTESRDVLVWKDPGHFVSEPVFVQKPGQLPTVTYQQSLTNSHLPTVTYQQSVINSQLPTVTYQQSLTNNWAR